MMLTPANELPVGPDWGYEPKLDGYRMVAYYRLGKVALISRNGVNHTDFYPAVAEQLPDALLGQSAVLDCELVGLDEAGGERFEELRRAGGQVALFAFDLLEFQGRRITDKPLLERRDLLRQLLVPQPAVKRTAMAYDPVMVLGEVAKRGMEGVVAKQLSSPYIPGIRTRRWKKLVINPHPERQWNRSSPRRRP